MPLIHRRLALSALALGVVLMVLPKDVVALFLSDDAYYYLKVAANNTLGLGLTFDGINLTNGWHPLWMLMIHPIYLLHLDLEISLRLALLLQLALYTGCLITACKIAEEHFDQTLQLSAITTISFFAPVTVIALNGLESSLVMLMQLTLIRFLLQYLLTPDSNAHRLYIGLLIGLFFLARLDSVFIILSVAVWLLIAELKRDSSLLSVVQRWFLPALVCLLLAISYLAWNLTHYGHVTPISGTLKSTFPEAIFRTGFLARVPHFLAAIITVTVWFIYRLWSCPTEQKSKYGLFLAITIGCLIHLMWSVLFMRWGTLQWHFVAQIPIIMIGVFDILTLRPSLTRFANVVGVLFAVTILFATLALRLGHHQERLDAVAWINSSIPEGKRVGLRDAGVVGYFSDPGIVNLDGLINSYEFYESILDRSTQAFLRQSSVDYIADAYVPCDYEQHRVLLYAPSIENPSKRVGEIRTFDKKDELAIFESKKLFETLRQGANCFVIWQGTGEVYPYRN